MATALYNNNHNVVPDEQRIKDVLSWKPPQELKLKCPYSFVSFDREKSPVLLINFGRWDLREIVEENGPLYVDLDKYIEAMFYRMVNQRIPDDRGTMATRKWVVIVDLAGYSSRQMMHMPTLQKINALTKLASSILQQTLKKCIVVNSNFFFQSLWKMLKPIMGDMVAQVELHGTNSDKWKGILLTQIHEEHLPISLGGQSRATMRRPSAMTF